MGLIVFVSAAILIFVFYLNKWYVVSDYPWFKGTRELLGVLGSIIVIWGFIKVYMAKVEIVSDKPFVHVEFYNSEPQTPPHIDVTITDVIENHCFDNKTVLWGFVLQPDKFQNLRHHKSWTFDNRKDIRIGLIGGDNQMLIGNKTTIKPRQGVQSYISYRFWTKSPLRKEFINEIALLDNRPLTIIESLSVDEKEISKVENIFTLREAIVLEYVKWLISKDDDPKALQVLQELKNLEYIGRDATLGYYLDRSLMKSFVDADNSK